MKVSEMMSILIVKRPVNINGGPPNGELEHLCIIEFSGK